MPAATTPTSSNNSSPTPTLPSTSNRANWRNFARSISISKKCRTGSKSWGYSLLREEGEVCDSSTLKCASLSIALRLELLPEENRWTESASIRVDPRLRRLRSFDMACSFAAIRDQKINLHHRYRQFQASPKEGP